MKTYNDYANLVWNYLRNYTQLKITLLNLQDEARIKKSQAEAFSTAISRYGDDPTGGYCELNQTERGAANGNGGRYRADRTGYRGNSVAFK